MLENADGSPRTPNVPLGISEGMYSRGIHGPRLTESPDPEVSQENQKTDEETDGWMVAPF